MSAGEQAPPREAPRGGEVRTDVGISYWKIVRAQFRKNHVAMFGRYCVIFLALLAIYAPLIASDRPYWYSGPDPRPKIANQPIEERASVSYSPWLLELFDRNEVTQPVDLFFNLMMLALPPFAFGFWLLRRALRKHDLWSIRAARRTLGVMAALFVWVFFGIYVSDEALKKPFWKGALFAGAGLRTSLPFADFHALEADAKKQGLDADAVFPPLPYDYQKTRTKEGGLPPDWFGLKSVPWKEGQVGHHPIGTTIGGRDVMTLLLYGTRISMTIGVIAVSIYVTIGIVLGSLAGYFGGWADITVSRLIEIFLCMPALLFILTVVAVFESRSIFLVMLVIGVISWPGVARLVRGEFLTQRGQEYVAAGRALGIPARRLIFRHILPNALTPVLVAATFGIAAAILLESGLSFLGLGDPTAASWGTLLEMGRHNTHKEWLILAPGCAIFFTVTVFNLVGEGLRDALDPKLRQ